jgi:hypothetical protein
LPDARTGSQKGGCMTPEQTYWVSLIFIAIGCFGLGAVVGTELMCRKAQKIIAKNFGKQPETVVVSPSRIVVRRRSI